MSDPEYTTAAQLAAIRAKRAARADAASAASDAQALIDETAIDEIEERLGYGNVAALTVAHVPGLPTRLAVRAPKSGELKRYRDRLRPQKDRRNREIEPDAFGAAEELAEVCLVYPDKETYERLLVARPAAAMQLGVIASRLGSGKEEDAGKD